VGFPPVKVLGGFSGILLVLWALQRWGGHCRGGETPELLPNQKRSTVIVFKSQQTIVITILSMLPRFFVVECI